jgi:hypothetical protein
MYTRSKGSIVCLTAMVLTVASFGSSSGGPSDACTHACFAGLVNDIKTCMNNFEGNEVALKVCLDGAKTTLDACLAQCTAPKPNNAAFDPSGLDADGFAAPLNLGATSYTIAASIDDPGVVVDNVEFHLVEPDGTDHLLGIDSSGGDGWNATFSPAGLGLSMSSNSNAAFYLSVQNAAGDAGVAGDTVPVRVFPVVPTASPWTLGTLVLAVLLTGASALVVVRRRHAR